MNSILKTVLAMLTFCGIVALIIIFALGFTRTDAEGQSPIVYNELLWGDAMLSTNCWISGTGIVSWLKIAGGVDRRVILRTDDNTNVVAATIGANLSFDGTTLSATGGSGDAGGTNARQGGTLALTNLSGNAIPFTNILVAGSGVTLVTNSGVVTVSSTGETIARASADVVVTSQTFVNATNLSFTVVEDTSYRFRFVVHYTTAATTTGIRFGVNGPASPTALRVGGVLPTGTGAMNSGSQTAYDTAIFAATTGPGSTAVSGIVEGVFRNGGLAGTFTLRVASETGSAVTILADSYGELQSF